MKYSGAKPLHLFTCHLSLCSVKVCRRKESQQIWGIINLENQQVSQPLCDIFNKDALYYHLQ